MAVYNWPINCVSTILQYHQGIRSESFSVVTYEHSLKLHATLLGFINQQASNKIVTSKGRMP